MSGGYLVIQFYAFFKYCMKLPDEYAQFVQIGILAIFILLEILLFVGNRYIKRVDMKQKSDVEEFKDIVRNFEMKRLEFDDASILQIINQLLDELKYSDPNSGECVREENLRLRELSQKIDKKSSVEEIQTICLEASKVLKKRNLKNKSERAKNKWK